MIPAKTAEPIEMPFGMWIKVCPSKYVLRRGARCRHPANKIEPSMCSGDAVFLLNYFDHLLQLLLLFMAALWNRAGHYIFILWFLLLVSIFLLFPRLFSAIAHWMFTILPHMVWWP